MKRSIISAVALVTMLTAGAFGLRGALAANSHATPVAPVAVRNCCLDPTCPPGCSLDCPPDCCPATDLVATPASGACPPCPFCP